MDTHARVRKYSHHPCEVGSAKALQNVTACAIKEAEIQDDAAAAAFERQDAWKCHLPNTVDGHSSSCIRTCENLEEWCPSGFRAELQLLRGSQSCSCKACIGLNAASFQITKEYVHAARGVINTLYISKAMRCWLSSAGGSMSADAVEPKHAARGTRQISFPFSIR
eukprot:4747188-Pleurochrysis_carterae.AAC.2